MECDNTDRRNAHSLARNPWVLPCSQIKLSVDKGSKLESYIVGSWMQQ